MRNLIYTIAIVFSFGFFSCSETTEEIIQEKEVKETEDIKVPKAPTFLSTYKILALGDSYTIGQSVCETCSYPEQLKEEILSDIWKIETINLKIVARTGWRTDDLLKALASEEIDKDYDFVTLLIGVNNQYAEVSFDVYEEEFPLLVSKAIEYVKGDKNRVTILSIPDYAYTSFGRGNLYISNEIAEYNSFAKQYCDDHKITFLNITDITQQGLSYPSLVASDGLHPSALAYEKFVERLKPLVIEKFKK